MKGIAHRKLGENENAWVCWDTVAWEFPSSKWGRLSRLKLAKIDQKKLDKIKLDKIKPLNLLHKEGSTQSEFSPEALYWLGVSYQKLGDNENAWRTWKKLTLDYHGKWTLYARRRLIEAESKAKETE
ncbi:MAG: hypothetical protein HRT89_16595 [Lentisphaeria bacterium]|nr:hypothetical protein [Lentisphaeria bacterium]